jgi:UDP-N-acetylmuramate dehydrogenase
MPIVIEKQVDLQPYNTFKVKATTDYLVRITSVNDVRELLSTSLFKENKRFILGGGSNVVFLHNFQGIVIKSEEKNIEIISESDTEVLVKASAGVVWHDFVQACLNKNWGGIENLSLIPGTVGAAPIQNIGAYGVELKEVVHQVDGVHLETGESISFNNSSCKFSYRESIFKHEWKENIFISSVTLRLTKKNHKINFNYDALIKHLTQQNITSPTIHDVSRAVIEVRQSKLPDPAHIGNAGSFFKNPVVGAEQLEMLKKQWPLIPSYSFENQSFKVPAGWLIENCGWKGIQIGNVGVHKDQALVIVNHGGASGDEIFQLSEKICNDVKSKFGLTLKREVNMIA